MCGQKRGKMPTFEKIFGHENPHVCGSEKVEDSTTCTDDLNNLVKN